MGKKKKMKGKKRKVSKQVKNIANMHIDYLIKSFKRKLFCNTHFKVKYKFVESKFMHVIME